MATCKLLSALLSSIRVPAVAKFIKYAHRRASGWESLQKCLKWDAWRHMFVWSALGGEIFCLLTVTKAHTPVWAYRSIPQATTNHCICSLQRHEICPAHKEKHMQPTRSGACSSCLLCCVHSRGKFLCYHELTGFVLPIEQRSAGPDPPLWRSETMSEDDAVWLAWEATVGQLISVWSAIVFHAKTTQVESRHRSLFRRKTSPFVRQAASHF